MSTLSAVTVVAGATGLVGQALVQQLAADGAWRETRALTRRALPPALNVPTVTSWQIDYDNMNESAAWLRGVDHIFCALGTTMRQAGSRAAFRRVDFEYALTLAKIGALHGVRHFLLVSALGADARSPIFYNRVKGELEDAVTALGFRSVTIARPSLLLGARPHRRFGEEIGKLFGVVTPLRWRPVPAAKVAAGLIAAAKEDRPGRRILTNAALLAASV